MQYYSTRLNSDPVSLSEAVIKGLAPDNGLYMPDHIAPLTPSEFKLMPSMSFVEMSVLVAQRFFGNDIDQDSLAAIVADTLTFDTPLVEIERGIHSLELFHGPTLAFKDVGARFMARMLRHFLKKDTRDTIHVLVATSGDSGSAVANGFLGVEGIQVHVLYPKGKVSPIQECQFTTLGRNITAIEVDGTFDDCQRMVKSAFLDDALNRTKLLTSANSINIARLFPQTFYYFNAWASLRRDGRDGRILFSVPSGNFGNLTAGLIAARMGLPDVRFVAANNANRVVYDYLQGLPYSPRPSIPTIANAMDVGEPSNYARIVDLFGGDDSAIRAAIAGSTFTDAAIADGMRECHRLTGYMLDPHGACARMALAEHLRPGEEGVFLETAHPAKFKATVEKILDTQVTIPSRLATFMTGAKRSVPMTSDYDSLRKYLLEL